MGTVPVNESYNSLRMGAWNCLRSGTGGDIWGDMGPANLWYTRADCASFPSLPPPQGCIRTAVHRRRRGGYPPPRPPPLPFQCLRLTAKILLRLLQCQEDLRLKFLGPPLAGTIRGPWEEGGRSQTPLPAPSNTSLPIPPPPLKRFPCCVHIPEPCTPAVCCPLSCLEWLQGVGKRVC